MDEAWVGFLKLLDKTDSICSSRLRGLNCKNFTGSLFLSQSKKNKLKCNFKINFKIRISHCEILHCNYEKYFVVILNKIAIMRNKQTKNCGYKVLL